MNIVAIVGSLRKDSYNKKVANFMKERYKGKLDIEVLLLNDIPMFNEDIEENPPAVVKEFKEKIKNSDGILFVTPEYNHSIPGALKNALDWCSRVERVMANKPSFIVGASNGTIGTARCQSHLRQVLNTGGIAVKNLATNEMLIKTVQDQFDGDELINETTIKYLDRSVDRFLDWAEKF